MTGPSLFTRVAIVGAGVAGLGMAAALLESGITDFVVAPQDNDVDGTHRLQRHLFASARVSAARYQDHDGTWLLHTRTGMGFWAENLVIAGYATNPAAEPVDIRGREDTRLHRIGPREAFLGVAVKGFPNLYLLGGPNRVSVSATNPVMTPVQIRYIVECLEDHYHLGVPLEVRPEAVHSYQEWLDEQPVRTVLDFDRFAQRFNPATALASVEPERCEVGVPFSLPDLPVFSGRKVLQ